MPTQLSPPSPTTFANATEMPPHAPWATVCLFALPVMALTTSFGLALMQLVILLAFIWMFASNGRRGIGMWYSQNFPAIRGIVLAFAGFFVLSAFRAIGTKKGLSNLDGPLRMLFALSCIGFVGYLKPQIRYFWLGLCIGVIGAFFLALIQKYWVGMARVDGYTHHPISFGDLALALGCMSVCAFGSWRQRNMTLLPLIALFCGLSASILSASRGGWIALPLLLPLLWKMTKSKHNISGKTLAVLFLAAIALLALAYAVPATGVAHRVDEAISDVNGYFDHHDANTSVGIRLELWKASIMMFADHPWLGVGRDQFQPALHALAAQGR